MALHPWQWTQSHSALVYDTAEHLRCCAAGLTAGACDHLLRSLLPLCADAVMYRATRGCPCHAVCGCSHLGEPCHLPGCVPANPPPWWCTYTFPASAPVWDVPASTVCFRLSTVVSLLLDHGCDVSKAGKEPVSWGGWLSEGTTLSFRPAHSGLSVQIPACFWELGFVGHARISFPHPFFVVS